MWGAISKCGETSSYVKNMCTAVSLGIHKMKKLVNMMKQVKMIKLLTPIGVLAPRLRTLDGPLVSPINNFSKYPPFPPKNCIVQGEVGFSEFFGWKANDTPLHFLDIFL